MNTDYFKEHQSEGLNLVNEAISKLEIKVTSETTVEQLHLIHNAITAYVFDHLKEEKD